MNKKILTLYEKVGMKHFWKNFFDSGFYVLVIREHLQKEMIELS